MAVCLSLPAVAQTAPSPSLVAPPSIVAPAPTARIALPQVAAGAQTPEQARRLYFKLTGLDVSGEFPELAEARQNLVAPLLGKRISVADLFDVANRLQQLYVNAGYPLARVVTLPQEIDKQARVKLRVIDGHIERMDLSALAEPVRGRVSTVLAPLVGKGRLTQGQLERQLLLAGETPGLILNATFGAGKSLGGSLLVLTGRYRPVSASLYIDNAMPKTFGGWQAVTAASFNNLLGLGEQFSFSAAGLPDSNFFASDPTRRYLSATAALPLSIDGWKLEIGGTDGRTTPRVTASANATQGILDQGRIKLSYAAIKRRDSELSFNGRFDATNESINSLAFSPVIPLSRDRVRSIRGGFEGIARLRETGTTISYNATISRGLDILGARMANNATPLLPLSRQGADAVYTKLDGRIDLNQSLPEQFFLSVSAAGQSSFNKALLTSEQFDLSGATGLSGFTSGALPGDTGWVVRGEFGRAYSIPVQSGGVTLTPYAFAAAGERIYIHPTVLEAGDVHARNFGAGLRGSLTAWNDAMPDSYGFIEWSRRSTNVPALSGQRIFAGIMLRY